MWALVEERVFHIVQHVWGPVAVLGAVVNGGAQAASEMVNTVLVTRAVYADPPAHRIA